MPTSSIETTIEKLSAELSLSKDQVKKLTEICQAHQAEQTKHTQHAARNANDTQDVSPNQDGLSRKINAILTQQQRSQFTAISKKFSPE